MRFNFEKGLAEEEAVQRRKEKASLAKQEFGPVDERVVRLAEKYKKLLEMDGFMPDSPMIKEFVKLSEHSLSSYPEAIGQLRKEIELLNETKFGLKDNKKNDNENDKSLRLAA